MGNSVLERFHKNLQQKVIQRNGHAILNEDDEIKDIVDDSPIVEPESLRQSLLEKINPKPEITISTDSPTMQIEVVHFSSVFEFAHWYESNKSIFSEAQQQPLNTLIEARNITLGGCNCDREKRKFIAEDYFKKFWTQNKSTDLLPTLIGALKTKKVLFGDFLSFPE